MLNKISNAKFQIIKKFFIIFELVIWPFIRN